MMTELSGDEMEVNVTNSSLLRSKCENDTKLIMRNPTINSVLFQHFLIMTIVMVKRGSIFLKILLELSQSDPNLPKMQTLRLGENMECGNICVCNSARI